MIRMFVRRLRVLSFNVDGLDTRFTEERARAAANIVIQQRPDVVLLQELVAGHDANLLSGITKCGYTLSTANRLKLPPSWQLHPYWCGLGAPGHTAQVQNAKLHPFAGSGMGRHCIEAVVQVGPWRGFIVCSHFESLGQPHNKAERLAQMREVWTRLEAALPHHDFVLFGGDTNLRDSEVPSAGEAGGWPPWLLDAWTEAGQPLASRFTWDPTAQGKPGDWPRLRFDRVWYGINRDGVQGSGPSGPRLLSFRPLAVSLVGTSPMPVDTSSSLQELGSDEAAQATSPPVYPSDHWGLMVDFLMEGTTGQAAGPATGSSSTGAGASSS